MQIYIADISPLSEPEVFYHYLDRIDETRRQKVWQCRNEADKKRSLLAGYLIQAGMKERISEESGLPQEAAPLSFSYTFGADGKPYFADYPEIQFSLSHSGQYVAAVFDHQAIGIDLQHRRELKLNLAEHFFSDEDKELLKKLGDGDERINFYKLWTVKEAYMKLTGEGLKQGLNRTFLEPDEKDKTIGRIRKKDSGEGAWYKLCDTEIEKYSIAVCSYSRLSDIKIKEVKLTDEKL